MAELFGSAFAFLLTVLVLSYLLGDNPLYRMAVHLFVGVTAGYAAVVVWHMVIAPRLTLDPLNLIGLALAMVLLFRGVRVAPALTGWVLALMVGVGAAVAVAGAVTGTLFPQISATFVSLLPAGPNGVEQAVSAAVMVVGTLSTLAFFYYHERGQKILRVTFVKPLGQIFIGAALGAMYAGALAASLAVFSHSLWRLWTFYLSVSQP